jgi:purine-binding chemotaxis protein CheW
VKKRKKISFKKILSKKSSKEEKTKAKEKEIKKKEKTPREEPVPKKEIAAAGVSGEEVSGKKERVLKKPEEKKQINAEPKKEAIRRKREELMIVRVSEEFYGIPLSCVEEIKREIKLTSTPHLSEFLSGIAEIRDSFVPVVNLANLFGIEQELTEVKRIPVVTTRIADQLIGFQVSEIVEITEIQKNEILPLPDIFPPHLFSGGYTYKSFIVGVLKVESLLKGKQIQSFKEKINEVIK